MKPKLRAAILGLGRMASFIEDEVVDGSFISHAAAYRAEPRFDLVGGCDVSAVQREKFGARWGVSGLYDSPEELLRAERPAVVSVCSPTELHLAHCMSALAAGCAAIFCEKPLCSRLDEAEALIAACRKKNVLLAVNHTRRWMPNVRLLRELLDRGSIGAIQSAVVHYGGGIGNVGTHIFDLLRSLLGEASAVTALREAGENGDPDLPAYVEFRDGIGCHLVANETRHFLLIEVELIGTAGRLRLCRNGEFIERSAPEKSARYAYAKELPATPEILRSDDRTPPLRLALREIARLLDGEVHGGPACRGEDGLAAMEIACAIGLSAERGCRRVALPLEKRNVKLFSRQRGTAPATSTH